MRHLLRVVKRGARLFLLAVVLQSIILVIAQVSSNRVPFHDDRVVMEYHGNPDQESYRLYISFNGQGTCRLSWAQMGEEVADLPSDEMRSRGWGEDNCLTQVLEIKPQEWLTCQAPTEGVCVSRVWLMVSQTPKGWPVAEAIDISQAFGLTPIYARLRTPALLLDGPGGEPVREPRVESNVTVWPIEPLYSEVATNGLPFYAEDGSVVWWPVYTLQNPEIHGWINQRALDFAVEGNPVYRRYNPYGKEDCFFTPENIVKGESGFIWGLDFSATGQIENWVLFYQGQIFHKMLMFDGTFILLPDGWTLKQFSPFDAPPEFLDLSSWQLLADCPGKG